MALRVDLPALRAAAAKAGKPIDKHRDGTQGIYLNDPAGNVIELIYYPPAGTAYDKNEGAVPEDLTASQRFSRSALVFCSWALAFIALRSVIASPAEAQLRAPPTSAAS